MFTKGQKIVCINDEFPEAAVKMYVQLPKKDTVYTVRSVYIGRGSFFRHDSGTKDGEIGVLLEEIRNPVDPGLKAGLRGELGFNSERFAPLEVQEDEETRIAYEEKEDVVLIPG